MSSEKKGSDPSSRKRVKGWTRDRLIDEELINKNGWLGILLTILGILISVLLLAISRHYAPWAAGICAWLVVVVGFYDYFLLPKPGDDIKPPNPWLRWCAGLLASLSALLSLYAASMPSADSKMLAEWDVQIERRAQMDADALSKIEKRLDRIEDYLFRPPGGPPEPNNGAAIKGLREELDDVLRRIEQAHNKIDYIEEHGLPYLSAKELRDTLDGLQQQILAIRTNLKGGYSSGSGGAAILGGD